MNSDIHVSSCFIFDHPKIVALSKLQILKTFLFSSEPGIPFDISIQNQKDLHSSYQKNEALSLQISSLKSALASAESQIELEPSTLDFSKLKNNPSLKSKTEGYEYPPPITAFFPSGEEEFNENIVKGCQRMAMKLAEGEKLIPLNDLIESDERASEKIALLYEKAKSIIFSLATQVFNFFCCCIDVIKKFDLK